MGKFGIVSCAFWCNGCKKECPKYSFQCPDYRCVRETPPSINTRIGGASDEPPKSDKPDFANPQDVSGNDATNGGCQ